MYTKILVATDGSELAQKAVDHGVKLAKTLGANIIFVTVTESWSSLIMDSDFEIEKNASVDKIETAVNKSAENILNTAKEFAEKLGVEAETLHILDRPPAEGIIEATTLEDCDIVIMASNGHRGLRKMMLGSQTAKVLASCKKPVLVLR